MTSRSWVLSITVAALFQPALAQKVSDRKVVKQLKADIGYLASDKLEGRRTGSEGEKLAYEYIISYYKKNDITGYKGTDNKAQYQYPFTFVYGKKIDKSTRISLSGTEMQIKEEAFPLPFSADASVSDEVIPDIMEKGKIWLIPMFEDEEQGKDPHYNWEKNAFEQVEKAAKAGATGVVFYDKFDAKYPAVFNKHSEYEQLTIPVAYITNEGYKKYIIGKENILVDLNITLKKHERTGNNVLAYVNNNAPYTVILGAHYDHLGYGQDGNSLSTKKEIHNGADDNASGTAALMQLAVWIKDAGLKKYNYLFMHFSAEELGLLGSKDIVDELGLDSNKVAYMINMDMVGRLNDSTHALTVGGFGTSPVWSKVVDLDNPNFKIIVDSSGVGPSDHTSFYHKGIPVLFFFTGTHSDYHKPSDDADKINYKGEAGVMHYVYDIVAKMDNKTKPEFTVTKQSTVGKVRFKVTLGIMPDYSFQDGGVRIDGVSEGRPAIKAGLKAGDIITKLGKYEIRGMQTYMEALGEFEEGQKTEVTIMRDGKEMTFPLVFTPKD